MNRAFGLLLLIFLATNQLFGQEYERYKKLLDTTITSTYLGFDKGITLTVPFEWQADLDRVFPVVIIFDRQNERSGRYMMQTIDYLTSNEQMPSVIVVRIESTPEHRYHETLHRASNEKGLARENEQFLFEELIPLLEQQYKASSFRLFIGHSRYGYFSSSLLASRIDELNGVISLSPFFIQKQVNLADSVRNLDQQVFASQKYYRFGIGNDYPEDFWLMDSVVRQLSNPALDAKGALFPAADHNVTPGLLIAPALYEIFEYWSQAQDTYFANQQEDLSILPSLEGNIRKHYGSELVFSLGVLNGKGWYFYNKGEWAKAIEAWRLLLQSYPNFSEAYLYIIDAQLELKQEVSQTIAGFRESFAKSEMYSPEEREELQQEFDQLME